MARLLLTSLAFLIACNTSSPPQSADSKSPYIWLAGCWERTDLPPETSGGERWELLGEQSLKGFGFNIWKGDTVFYEDMEIRDGALRVTGVQEDSAVVFSIHDLSPTGFIASNPAHDFPKHIDYQMDGDTLRASVYADTMKVDFVFVRCGE